MGWWVGEGVLLLLLLTVPSGEGGGDALPTRTVADPEPQPLARKVGWGLKDLERVFEEASRNFAYIFLACKAATLFKSICACLESFYLIVQCVYAFKNSHHLLRKYPLIMLLNFRGTILFLRLCKF